MTRPVILLELNEINFEQVRAYCAKGELPAFDALLRHHPLVETESERDYEQLEPWIQWVTAHTGLKLAEHGIFRLGDCVRSDAEQIWEYLERNGRTVGAISPMNAIDRCTHPAFFMPDPWTMGQVSGSPLMRKLYGSIAQAVNDNAEARLSPQSAGWLLLGWMRYAQPSSYPAYLRYLIGLLRGRKWFKALFLDLLLADLFSRLVRRRAPDFASLFLNAGAHIQHHYLFSSSIYDGPHRNPAWYAKPDDDPVLDAYRLYDRIIAGVTRAFPASRLMLATGLHQDPHGEETFYWRLKDHAAFLRRIGIDFRSVEPRMSRDFLLQCHDAIETRQAEKTLRSVVSDDGVPLFELDNRGDSLFVALVWSRDVAPEFTFHIGDRSFGGLREEIAFVAIKNGRHNGIGYFLDTANEQPRAARVPLASLPEHICGAFGLAWQPRPTPARGTPVGPQAATLDGVA